ncbi:hypothetical protein M9458_014914, partial [Cirrhinus mrigala]
EELYDLREDVQRWQQEAQEQKESRVKEVQALKEELQSTQSRLQQHSDNLESLCRELEMAHRQQTDTEDEVKQLSRLHFHYITTSGSKYKCLAAVLRSQDAELIELKAGLLEAEKLATDAEARLQPLSESLELCKHKYQACLSKIAQLENTLHSREEDLKEAHSQ